MAQVIADKPILATEEELPLLRALAERLEASPAATLLTLDDEPILLPESVYHLIAGIVRTLASGDGVAVTPIEAELTLYQAANLLLVSHTTLLELLETGQIYSADPKALRPVRLADLIAFQQEERAYRRLLIAEIARDAQEMGLYDDDYLPPPDSDQP
jgi:hypothetical protein